MKIVGIVVEYNPLHNGHLYHINEVRRRSQCDVLVAVMSSSFTQRGEPAIIDKFTRTTFALQNGVDLVVELPFVFAVQNADRFAFTAIDTLHKLGVQEVYFGSEANSIDSLYKIGEVMASDEYQARLKIHLKDGYSFPTSSDMAMTECYPNDDYQKPNNILGVQYILAGKSLNSSIIFHTIQRISTDYFDAIKPQSNIQSATSIRKLIKRKEPIDGYVPTDVAFAFTTRKPVDYEDFYPMLQSIVSRENASTLQSYMHVTEGLENRIKSIRLFDSVDDFINQLITKRYTFSKLQRMIACILCNVKRDEIPTFEVPYLRILGMNEKGKLLLNQQKKTLKVPLYTKIKEGLHPYLDIELRVSKVYGIASDIDIYKEEFKPVII